MRKICGILFAVALTALCVALRRKILGIFGRAVGSSLTGETRGPATDEEEERPRNKSRTRRGKQVRRDFSTQSARKAPEATFEDDDADDGSDGDMRNAMSAYLRRQDALARQLPSEAQDPHGPPGAKAPPGGVDLRKVHFATPGAPQQTANYKVPDDRMPEASTTHAEQGPSFFDGADPNFVEI